MVRHCLDLAEQDVAGAVENLAFERQRNAFAPRGRRRTDSRRIDQRRRMLERDRIGAEEHYSRAVFPRFAPWRKRILGGQPMLDDRPWDGSDT